MTFSNGMVFSTAQRDNDVHINNCAASLGPWWHRNCARFALFALYGQYPTVEYNRGIKWENNWGKAKFAKYVTLMIRPN